MRKVITKAGLIFLSWLLILSTVPLPLAVSQPSSLPPSQVLGDARLSLIQGDVVLQTEAAGSEWGAAVINTPLVPGTKLWNPENGRSEIQFFGGSYLRSSASTEVDITNLSLSTDGDVIQVGVPQGRIYVNYAGSGVQDSVFQVDTPVTSVVSYGPSKFEVGIYEDGYTEVSVLNGSVDVQSQDGSTTVDAGTMLSMGSRQSAELSPMRPEDAWISWNLSRDSALVYRGPSRSYLPASLSVYGNDFDSYGRWVQTADYGYVWTPLKVAVGWAPYRVGRWCWIGGEYVWVSYEPWGWVPYHYGRWAFVSGIGWFWVPPLRTASVYWCPGFVAWIHTPTYVSWVPLAPGEIYYGHGYYGPNSVNITNININTIRINNVYVNARLTNGVTVVSRETFLTGRRVSIANVPVNPFRTGGKVAIGGPAIKPVKATALPDPAKVVPQKVLPPQEVMTKTGQVQHRQAAVQKNVSVFKPGERVKPMQIKKVEHPKPATVGKQHELGQPPVQQKGEVGKASGQEKKVGPASAQHREFGIAPPGKGEPSVPSAGKEQSKPSKPNVVTPQTQRPQSVAPNREKLGAPPASRKEVAPPSAQRGEKAAPPPHKEFGIAPQHGGQSVTPPASREPMSRPSAPNVVTPQPQRPQSVTPNRERMNTAPNRREVSPPSVQGGQRGGPSTQRQMGVAPPHGGSAVAPPVHSQGTNRPPVQSTTRPPSQRREPNN
jgi:hypothetical protein